MRRITASLAIVLGTLVASGCGATPPQVPGVQAQRVASAISGIAAACGESDQQRAFGRPEDISVLEADAGMRVRELAHVYRENPEWIYNADTLRRIVELSIRDLRGCALTGAADTLQRLLAPARS